MVFNLVADDQASRAFDQLARNVELSNAAIAKHNVAAGESSRALDDNAASADRSNSSLARMSGTLTETSKGFSLLATAAVAMAPAVLAGTAVLSAGLIGVGGIIASTGAAMGVFAVTAKSQFTALTTGYQNIQKLKEAAAAAPAGSAAQIADYKALAAAQAEYTKTFGPAAAGMNNLQTAWANWKTATAGQTNQILAEGLNLIAVALPKLRPLFDAGAAGAQKFLDAIKGWVQAGGLDRAVAMLSQLATAVGPYLQTTLSNLAKVAGALAPLFAGLAVAVAKGMANITGSMASWAAGGGPAIAFQSFMNFVNANGPALVNVLKNFADAAVKIAQALAPLAPISLAIAGALAQLIASAPPGLIQAAAVAFVAYSVAMKGLAVIVPIIEMVKSLTAAMFGLDMAMNANVIGLVVLAIVALGVAFYTAWTKSAGFRDFIKTLGADVLAMSVPVVQGLKIVVDAVLNFYGSIVNGAATAFGWIPGIGPKLKTAADAFNTFKTGVDNAFNSTITTMQGWQNKLTETQGKSSATATAIVADFNKQGLAANGAYTQVGLYSQAITQNGANSSAAQAARQQLITDLTNAGVNSNTARTDVTNYTNAITQNGVNSSQAQAARQQLITDITNAATNSRTGKTDMDSLTDAVRNHGATSTAAQNARQQLITDLTNTGMKASDATKLVDDLTRGITQIPATKNATVTVSGTGAWTIAQGSLQQKLVGYAAGGRIPGFGGGDTVPALLERGEVVVDKHRAQMLAPVFRAAGVPGFADGGIAGEPMWVAKSYDATVAYGINAITKALTDAINAAVDRRQSSGRGRRGGLSGGDSGRDSRRRGGAMAQHCAASPFNARPACQPRQQRPLPDANRERRQPEHLEHHRQQRRRGDTQRRADAGHRPHVHRVPRRRDQQQPAGPIGERGSRDQLRPRPVRVFPDVRGDGHRVRARVRLRHVQRAARLGEGR